MGKLVGLLSSGIGLAIEAASEYQSSNRSAGTRKNSQNQQDLTYGSREVYPDETQDQRDAKAFQELQSYADFQKLLSNRVQEDILRNEKYTPIDPQLLPQGQAFGDYFSHEPYIHPSLQQSNPPGRLPCPVIIPQRRPEDESRGWVRAYAPILAECDIDQYTFLNFIDAFNDSCKSSHYLDVVNVAGLGVGFAPGITPILVSMAVPIAVRLAKTAQTERRTASFLARANNELFAPHGLFAMVMTYKPTISSQAYTVDTSVPSLLPTPSTTSPYNSLQLPASAPLIFPEPDSPPTAQQNKFKQIGHFIADYGDRRAQARYAYENPDSALAGAPPPIFRSRWGDPNNPANSGGLASLITGRPKETEEERKGRKHRQRRRRSTSSKSSNGNEAKRPGLIRTVKGIVNGPGKEGQSSLRGLKGMSMQKDVLYLMIVNKPNDSESSSINSSPALGQQMSYPYREAKRIKSPQSVLGQNPSQQSWSLDSGVRWSPHEGYDHDSAPGTRGRSPPPAYNESQSSLRLKERER